jgi:hypothetical protein
MMRSWKAFVAVVITFLFILYTLIFIAIKANAKHKNDRALREFTQELEHYQALADRQSHETPSSSKYFDYSWKIEEIKKEISALKKSERPILVEYFIWPVRVVWVSNLNNFSRYRYHREMELKKQEAEKDIAVVKKYLQRALNIGSISYQRHMLSENPKKGTTVVSESQVFMKGDFIRYEGELPPYRGTTSLIIFNSSRTYLMDKDQYETNLHGEFYSMNTFYPRPKDRLNEIAGQREHEIKKISQTFTDRKFCTKIDFINPRTFWGVRKSSWWVWNKTGIVIREELIDGQDNKLIVTLSNFSFDPIDDAKFFPPTKEQWAAASR